jgi:hypothetical protein
MPTRKRHINESFGPTPTKHRRGLSTYDDVFKLDITHRNETKTIMATLRSDPAAVARNFLHTRGKDMIQAQTLETIIRKHQNKLKEDASPKRSEKYDY